MVNLIFGCLLLRWLKIVLGSFFSCPQNKFVRSTYLRRTVGDKYLTSIVWTSRYSMNRFVRICNIGESIHVVQAVQTNRWSSNGITSITGSCQSFHTGSTCQLAKICFWFECIRRTNYENSWTKYQDHYGRHPEIKLTIEIELLFSDFILWS